jgi:hypothetical protein
MPFFSLYSLLSLDRVSRRSEFKRYFGCTRKIFASDSTVSRALHLVKAEQLEQFQRSLLPFFEPQALSQIQLVPGGLYCRIGILYGFQMAQHYLVALCLAGPAFIPFVVFPNELTPKMTIASLNAFASYFDKAKQKAIIFELVREAYREFRKLDSSEA